MAINIIKDESSEYEISLNNGDLGALNEIVRAWSFKDKESVLKFALAILKDTSPGLLYQEKNRMLRALKPTSQLMSKESHNGESAEQ